MNKLIVPKGWTAFYDANTKKVFGLHEFKNGGKAETSLTLITKTTKEEVLESIKNLNLTYTEPTK